MYDIFIFLSLRSFLCVQLKYDNLMKAIFFILSLLTAVYGCRGENKNNDDANQQPVDSVKVEVVQQNEDDEVVVEETIANEDIVLKVWKKYFESKYCDIITDNYEQALSLLDKKSPLVASLLLDGSNHPIVRESNSSSNSDEESEDYYEEDYEPTVTETFACYALDAGGYLVLWYNDASDWGRKIFAVFKFENNVLTRLKNAFPPFESDFIDKKPSFDWDNLVKLSGTEVVYFMQDCWIGGFYTNGFTVSLGGMEETFYKFNGSAFVKED